MQLAIEFTRQGFTSFTRSVVEIVIMAGIAGGLTQTTQDSMASMLRGAGVAALVALGLLLMLATVIAVSWMMARDAMPQAADDRVGHVAGGWYLTAADGWDWPRQRDYLRDVDAARAGFSQAGAAEWGDIEPEQFNALVRRMVTLQMYEYANGRDHSNGGRWTARGKEMMAGIRRDDANSD